MYLCLLGAYSAQSDEGYCSAWGPSYLYHPLAYSTPTARGNAEIMRVTSSTPDRTVYFTFLFVASLPYLA